MSRADLEIFLPSFMLVFFVLAPLWSWVRNKKKSKLLLLSTDAYKYILNVKKFFKMMLISLMLLVLIYAYLPEYYNLFGPIEFLDNAIVNTIGVLILKLSLGWIVIAQLTIDRSAFMVDNEMDVWNYNRLILYSEKLILTGMLVMFFGLFVTISSGASVVIFLIGSMLYEKLLRVE